MEAGKMSVPAERTVELAAEGAISMPSVSPLVAARSLGKRFFRKSAQSAQYFNAVAPLDLDLLPGQFTVLMGRSGSGKSTLMNMLCGLLAPTSGTVECAGRDIYSLSDAELSRFRNQNFGIIPQGHTSLHSLNVLQNVLIAQTLYAGAEGVQERARQLLEEVGIANLAESYPKELSGGELRRMAVARALACSPKVIFADEPTGDLDDENTNKVLGLLRKAANQGTGVFMVTHEQEARSFADRVLRMDAGAVQEVSNQA